MNLNIRITNGDGITSCCADTSAIDPIPTVGNPGDNPTPSAVVIVIEGFVGGELVITGTDDALVGFVDGSDELTLPGFENVRVWMERGGQRLRALDNGNGIDYYTKDINSDTILLSTPLEEGELIYIMTIPFL